ncbi:MAG: extracellular solute-binding protein [Pirellulales bacterium]
MKSHTLTSRAEAFDRRQFIALGTAIAALGMNGCQPGKEPAASSKPEKGTAKAASLRLLVLDDDALRDAIASLWKAQLESDAQFVNLTRKELLEAKRVSADVLVFPLELMGTLIENGLLDPLQTSALEDDALNFRDFWQSTRMQVCRFGGNTYAIPLSSPALYLVYRQDVFKELGIAVPTTWEEVTAATKQLAAWCEKEPGRTAIALPLANGQRSRTLLTIAAAQLADNEQVSPLFDPNTMDSLVHLPPMVKGLETLVGLAAGTADRLSAREAWLRVAQGKCAMALAEVPFGALPEGTTEQLENLAYAAVPGSRERYDFSKGEFVPLAEGESPSTPLVGAEAWGVAISSSAGQLRLAERFLSWISSEENLTALGSQSQHVGPVRTTMKGSLKKWLPSGSSAEAIAKVAALQGDAATAQTNLVALRVAAADEYLAILDAAVEAALTGKAVQESLQQAKLSCDEVTKRLGQERQLRSLKRSYGQQLH